MRKTKFLLAGLLGLGVVGVASAAIADECSYSPYGDFRFALAPEGIAHFFDEDFRCDPWRVIPPDPSVRSVRIVPYSSWTDAPARAVTINRNGTLTVGDPVPDPTAPSDWPEWNYETAASVRDPAQATDLLRRLTPITRTNRLTDEDEDAVAARLEREGADLTDMENYLVAPKIPCRGIMQDGGGADLEVENDVGETYQIALSSFCHSIAKQQAIKATSNAREKVFEATNFAGEHFVDELSTDRL